MKQILQNLKNGETLIEDVPAPRSSHGHLSIATRKTLVSAGTERMLVDFGKGNLIQKARSQPDKVRQVIDKVKTDGLMPTLDAVRNKLSTPLPLGYCNVGVIHEVGAGVEGYAVGERVISNGKHAELVVVPKNLCAKIPDQVDDESAAFTVIGAIALQGIRLVNPTLGETVVVTGLGLIGLIAVQLLKANGCRVLGLDFDPAKLQLAQEFGAEVVELQKGADPITAAEQFTQGQGVDAVLITASSKSNEPIHQAAAMCRKRGRIVLVGVVGMEMSRADFYEKELSFQVSCSYGPGRYDPSYEEHGQDYPLPYVRWTEQRNFQAILELMADGKLDMKPLISHRFDIGSAQEAYELISETNPLGVLIEYNNKVEDLVTQKRIEFSVPETSPQGGPALLGFIGAGNYAGSTLIPAFASANNASFVAIASSTGVSSVNLAKKFGIKSATTDTESLIANDEVNTLVITTRHNSHAHWVLEGLRQGKHIFVEKPLALNLEELDEIESSIQALGSTHPLLMVGFNRRYSPLVAKIKTLLQAQSQPATFIMTVNAGHIPSDHWTQDPEVGGGRIIGEGCHFIDLLRYLSGAPISSVQASRMQSECNDTVTITLNFENGSCGTVHYFANGNKAFPKERLEVFCGGGILQLDNFKSLRGFRWPKFQKMKLSRQDKGQKACVSAFLDAIASGSKGLLIPESELFEVAKVCIDLETMLKNLQS